jgi:redox-sensitive bicupin YhaK (pirin superfamily)
VKRAIDKVIKGAPEHWVGDGFHVSNYFPAATDTQKRMSPFFLLDYHQPESYEATSRRRGVGTHPHRGFETVTIAYQGSIAHEAYRRAPGALRPVRDERSRRDQSGHRRLSRGQVRALGG